MKQNLLTKGRRYSAIAPRVGRLHSSAALLVAAVVLLTLGVVRAAYAEEPNTLSSEEKTAGWRLLFDGQTTAGWRGYKSTTMPASW